MPTGLRSRPALSSSDHTFGEGLPALQLRDLDEISAGVVQHGDSGGGHVRRWHGELGAARCHPFVIPLQVVGEEHRRGLALLERRLLVVFGGQVVVERQLQFGAVRVLWPSVSRSTDPTCGRSLTGCSDRRTRWMTPFRTRGCGSAEAIRRASTTLTDGRLTSAGAGNNHSSLSARRRNSSGTERPPRTADP